MVIRTRVSQEQAIDEGIKYKAFHCLSDLNFSFLIYLFLGSNLFDHDAKYVGILLEVSLTSLITGYQYKETTCITTHT